MEKVKKILEMKHIKKLEINLMQECIDFENKIDLFKKIIDIMNN